MPARPGELDSDYLARSVYYVVRFDEVLFSLEALRELRIQLGLAVSMESVPYEFQREGNQMMRVHAASSR